MYMSEGSLALFFALGEAGVIKWLMNSLVLMSQNHSIMAHHVYIKPCGALDKSCVFPADEN